MHRSFSVLSQPWTPKKERIIYCCLKIPDATNYDFVQNSKYFFMMLDYLIIRDGTFDGVILIINSKNISWRHFTKTPMTVLKKLLGFVQVCKLEKILFVIFLC